MKVRETEYCELSVIKIADIPEEHDKYVELSGKA
jgi:hypothetical protein